MSDWQVVRKLFKKVIPPNSFKFDSISIEEALKIFVISRPLEQQIQIGRGFYDLKLVQKKAITLKQYKKLVDPNQKLIKGMSVPKIESFVS